MDVFQEKQIRRTLDELMHLHRLSSLGQLPPDATKRSSIDILFEIRIILIPRDGQSTSAYLIPWEQLQSAGAILQKRKADLVSLSTSVPDGIDPMVIARDLGMQAYQPSSPES